MSNCNNNQLNPSQLEVKDNYLDNIPDQRIFITLCANPHAFCYTTWPRLLAGIASVFNVESQLVAHCNAGNQLKHYVPGQNVIVRFLPLKNQKLLRGDISQACGNNKYLVWAIDYGLNIICKAEDLWLLPANLSQRYIDFQWGGLANVAPHDGNTWSQMSVNVFKEHLMKAQQLLFRSKCKFQQTFYGQLLIKPNESDKDFVDVAMLMVAKNCARWNLRMKVTNFQNPYHMDMDMAIINDADFKLSAQHQFVITLPNNIFVALPPPNLSVKSTVTQPNSTKDKIVDEPIKKEIESIFNNQYHKLPNNNFVTLPPLNSSLKSTVTQSNSTNDKIVNEPIQKEIESIFNNQYHKLPNNIFVALPPPNLSVKSTVTQPNSTKDKIVDEPIKKEIESIFNNQYHKLPNNNFVALPPLNSSLKSTVTQSNSTNDKIVNEPIQKEIESIFNNQYHKLPNNNFVALPPPNLSVKSTVTQPNSTKDKIVDEPIKKEIESIFYNQYHKLPNNNSNLTQSNSTKDKKIDEPKKMEIKSIFNNKYHKFGKVTRSLKCPSLQQERLKNILEHRNTLQVPTSANRLSKVDNSNDNVVESSLRPISSNPSSTSSSNSSNSSFDSYDTADDQLQPDAPNVASMVRQKTTKRRNILEMFRRPMVPPIEVVSKTLDTNPCLPKLIEENRNIEKTNSTSFATQRGHETMRQHMDNQTKKEDLNKKQEQPKPNQRRGFNRASHQSNLNKSKNYLDSIPKSDLNRSDSAVNYNNIKDNPTSIKNLVASMKNLKLKDKKPFHSNNNMPGKKKPFHSKNDMPGKTHKEKKSKNQSANGKPAECMEKQELQGQETMLEYAINKNACKESEKQTERHNAKKEVEIRPACGKPVENVKNPSVKEEKPFQSQHTKADNTDKNIMKTHQTSPEPNINTENMEKQDRIVQEMGSTSVVQKRLHVFNKIDLQVNEKPVENFENLSFKEEKPLQSPHTSPKLNVSIGNMAKLDRIVQEMGSTSVIQRRTHGFNKINLHANEKPVENLKNLSVKEKKPLQSPQTSPKLNVSIGNMEKLDRIVREMGETSINQKSTNRFNKLNLQVNEKTNNEPAIRVKSKYCKKTPMEIPTNSQTYLSGVLLAHSAKPVSPMFDGLESLFCVDLKKYLSEMKLLNATPSQLYAWPHLMRGNSLMLIDRHENERSLCYLPAICCQVMRDMRAASVSGIGPLAVLLTDTAISSQILFNQCNEMMAAYQTNMLKVVNTHAHSMNEVTSVLLNSCGILVTTVTHLKEILLHGLLLINSQRLKYFILDEYDNIRSKSPDLLNDVLQLLEKPKIPQTIFISRQWHGRIFLNLLQRFGENPLLIFSDFLEAAMYGGIKLNGTLTSKTNKTEKLLSYLALHKPLKKRTVIYCQDIAELVDLKTSLRKAGYECVEPSHAVDQKTHQLLLLLDVVPFSIRNYELVIHFSLPSSWAKFSHRFHVLSNNIDNWLAPSNEKRDIVTYIMLDENNQNELWQLVQFFRVHNVVLDETIKQLYANCQKLTESCQPICPNVLSCGDCSLYICNKRHYTISDDYMLPTTAMWQPGTVVRCTLLKIYDPVHFAFMPIKYKGKESNAWQDATNLSGLRKLSTSLYMHMYCEKNRRIKQCLKVSDICVIRRGGNYQRVRIVDTSNERFITVKLLDEGTEMLNVKRNELLECDARFTVEPPLAIDVRLCGLAPIMAEADWHSDAKKLASDILSARNDNQTVQFMVEFAMLDVVYVRKIAVVQDCQTMRTSVKLAQLQDELVLKNFGKPELQSMQKLRKLHEHIVEEQQKLFTNEIFNEDENELVQMPKEKSDSEQEVEFEPKVNVDQNKIKLLFDAFKRYLMNSKTIVANETTADKNNVQVKQHMNTNIKTIETEQDKELEDMIINSVGAKTFFTAFLQDLNSDDIKVRQASEKLVQELLGSDIDIDQAPTKIPTPNTSIQTPEAKKPINVKALHCGVIAGSAVRPKVRWHQTQLHIDLIFEQQVPQYALRHQGNVLIYQVTETIPPQRCVLNLLGEVEILSERQHGYQLHVKLAKQGLNVYWPSLLNSLHSQQHSHWLIYDTERAQQQQSSLGLTHWTRYQLNPYVEGDNDGDGSIHSADELKDLLSDEEDNEKDDF